MTSPFDPDYKAQLKPLPARSTRASALKQALHRERHGNAFDRYSIRLTETDTERAKAAIIKTPSCMRPREGG